MIFGLGKPTTKPDLKKGFSINVDGKEIQCGGENAGVMNLRKILMTNKVDVYPLRAKLTGNCGGAGICGTCAVKVLDGMPNLNPPSKNEQNTLKGKPADWRLSCAARVNGPIKIKTKP
jgi:ferredoxin